MSCRLLTPWPVFGGVSPTGRPVACAVRHTNSPSLPWADAVMKRVLTTLLVLVLAGAWLVPAQTGFGAGMVGAPNEVLLRLDYRLRDEVSGANIPYRWHHCIELKVLRLSHLKRDCEGLERRASAGRQAVESVPVHLILSTTRTMGLGVQPDEHRSPPRDVSPKHTVPGTHTV